MYNEETLEVKIARMEEKIDNILLEIKEIKEGKADRWVQQAMVFILGSVFSALLIFLLEKLLS